MHELKVIDFMGIEFTDHKQGFFEVLHDILPTWTGRGQYTQLAGNPSFIWADNTNLAGVDMFSLDDLYLLKRGDAWLPLKIADRIKSGTADQIKQAKAEIIYNISRVNRKKWIDLWDTIFYDYDPIENYNMLEQLVNDITTHQHGHQEQLTNALNHIHGHQEELTNALNHIHGHQEQLTNALKQTHSGTDTDTPGVTTTETDQRKVYNSASFSDTDKKTVAPSGHNTTQHGHIIDDTGTATTNHSGTDQDTGTATTVHSGTDQDTGTATTVHSGSDQDTRNYRLTRTGNIGVTTSQQMIEQQRQLVAYDYFEFIVFPDIDKYLTLSVY